jgi:hypothetical protein
VRIVVPGGGLSRPRSRVLTCSAGLSGRWPPEAARTSSRTTHLVVALGASTNEQLIPGSSNAFTFKTMADALVSKTT